MKLQKREAAKEEPVEKLVEKLVERLGRMGHMAVALLFRIRHLESAI